MRLILQFVFVLPILSLGSSSTLGAEWTIEVFWRSDRLEGTPLGWSSQTIDLLGRDGSWWTFPLDEAQDYRKLSYDFRPLTQGEQRALLMGEFGAGYEVSGTGNYLVVHPAGRRDRWAHRFEELHRTFVQYFSVRGFRLESPRFPLVAIAFPTRQEFSNYAARQGVTLPSGVLGYYSRQTNRVLLYDLTADDRGFSANDNIATIIHEATHQMAFNTRVHNRFAASPIWTIEGLATMFEAPGVHDARHNATKESRVNRDRLTAFREYAAERQTGKILAEMIATDRIFQTHPDIAYAHAWALTFFLSEQYPQKYASYLAKTAERPALAGLTAAERIKDFRSEFEIDFAMLESRLLRFVDSLR